MIGLADAAAAIPIDQAKESVLRECDRWIGRQPSLNRLTSQRGFQFCRTTIGALAHVKLVAGSIDRWLIVHNWLLGAGKVAD
jgi:hypothetical protein